MPEETALLRAIYTLEQAQNNAHPSAQTVGVVLAPASIDALLKFIDSFRYSLV